MHSVPVTQKSSRWGQHKIFPNEDKRKSSEGGTTNVLWTRVNQSNTWILLLYSVNLLIVATSLAPHNRLREIQAPRTGRTESIGVSASNSIDTLVVGSL